MVVVDGKDYLIFVSYDEDFLNRTITQIQQPRHRNMIFLIR